MTKIFVFIVIAVAVIAGAVFISRNLPSEAPGTSSGEAVQTEDLVLGTGAEAKLGDTVSVHYVGTLTDGTKFDSSIDRNEPFGATLGAGEVIKGWEEGVLGMKVGGKRKIAIPHSLGYPRGVKDQQTGGYIIPPNSTIVFEIELLAIK